MEGGVLRFNNVDGSESGSYICTATNSAGSVTATATFNVAGKNHPGLVVLLFQTPPTNTSYLIDPSPTKKYKK